MSDEPAPEPRIQPQLPSAPFNGLAIIGEAAGQEEIEQGYPFVGRSGRLLDTALREVGIDRSCCYVTNVFFSRPPNNKIDTFFRQPDAEVDAEFIARWGMYRGRVTKEANRHDLDRLTEELKQQRPAFILLLGATALWRINQENGITAARGNWSLSQPYGGNRLVGIMPTWHPSAVLRNPKEKMDEFVGDILQIKQAIDALQEQGD